MRKHDQYIHHKCSIAYVRNVDDGTNSDAYSVELATVMLGATKRHQSILALREPSQTSHGEKVTTPTTSMNGKPV